MVAAVMRRRQHPLQLTVVAVGMRVTPKSEMTNLINYSLMNTMPRIATIPREEEVYYE